MLVLITYDVSVVDAEGPKRLRYVAKTCEDYGQRVQNSVFECLVDPAQFIKLKNKLLNIIKPEKDSLRFYHLGKNWKRRVEHYGVKPAYIQEEPLIL
ncbi:MAG: CRISPR-associated endonuclease Cas2 [Dethiobacteria bacterium]